MTYENFIVPNIYWEYVLGQHRVSFINEYYKKHKNYPSDEILQEVVLTTEEKEKYKRIFYAQYCVNGTVPSEPNTPSNSTPPVSGDDNDIDTKDMRNFLNEQNWIELPSMDNNNLEYYTHFVSTELNEIVETKRNYTFGFSKKDNLSHWVAYHLNNHLISGNYPSNLAEWAYDPLLGKNSPAPFNGYGGLNWDRGHLMSISNRTGSYYYLLQMSFGSNIVPQNAKHNNDIWETIDETINDLMHRMESNEAYVVAGVIVNDQCEKTKDSDGKDVTIPKLFYKVGIIYSNAARLQRQWEVVCVMTENRNYVKPYESNIYYTIKQLEDIVGITLFPNLKERVGEELYNEIKNQTPKELL